MYTYENGTNCSIYLAFYIFSDLFIICAKVLTRFADKIFNKGR